jgi:hypothetical protein
MRIKNKFVLAFFLLLSAFSALAGQDNIPGQRPMLVLDNTFQFITGSWADYTYFDKQKNESTRLYFSILERETVKNAPYIWMEIEAAVKDAPVVVTRVLIEEKTSGPLKIDQAIVQVQGYSPFSVPKKYLEGQDQQVGQFETAHIVNRLAQQVIEHNGNKINAVTAEAETDKGDKMSITYSLELPPIAVYQAENKDFRLSINDWGMDAKSKISGTPESFLIWVLDQIDEAFTKSDKPASTTNTSRFGGVLGNTLTVKEVAEGSVYDGTWTRRAGTDVFDAVWNGSVRDVIEIESVNGNQIVLYRQGNKGRYSGTLSADGMQVTSGTASWYAAGWSWSAIVSDR